MSRTALLVPCLVVLPVLSFAQERGPTLVESGNGQHLVILLFSLVILILAAKFGGEAAERLGQPAVLGELTAGLVLGNVALVGIGFPLVERLRHSPELELLANLGVIILLFEVGLASHMKELLAVGLSALLVAVIGVIGPLLLGYGASAYFLGDSPWYVHLFAGATLAATSVGITARVLRDLNRTDTQEARIILGAAVIDDVLGLIILAVVSGLVTSVGAAGHPELSARPILVITAKALAFLLGAIVVGRLVHINAVRTMQFFRVRGIPVVIAMCHCLSLSALAGWFGLAPIVGAFAAGLILEESDYEVFLTRGEAPIEDLIRPLSTIFVPIFFVEMGLKVDLSAFASWGVLAFAGALTLAAVLGKQVCGLGVTEKRVSRILVGVGMIPRGEVGLIFTGIGATLTVTGTPVFSSSTVSAMVIMVMLTTLMTPPLLKLAYGAGHEPVHPPYGSATAVGLGSSSSDEPRVSP